MKKAASTLFLLLVTCFVASATLSSITSPAPQSTVVSNPHPTFCWTPAGGDAYGYHLAFSALPAQLNTSNGQYYGGSELGSFAVSGTCFTIPYDLPAPAGGIMYVTLIFYENATPGPTSQPQSQAWYPYPWTSSAGGNVATLVSPANGARLASTMPTFTFSTPSESPFHVSIGTTGAGSSDVFYSSAQASTTLTTWVPDTYFYATIYLRIESHLPSGWTTRDYVLYPSYVAVNVSSMASPAPGSQLAGPTTTFQFTTPTYMPLALAITSPGAAFGNLYANSNITGTSATVTLPAADTFPPGTVLTAVLFSKGINGGWNYSKVYSLLPYAPPTITVNQGFTPAPAPLDDYPTAVSSAAEVRAMSTTRSVMTAKGPLTYHRADLLNPGEVGYDQPFKDGDNWTYGFHFDAAEVALAVLGGPYEDDLKLGRVASTQPPGWSAATKGWMPQVLRPETITRDKRTQFGYTSSRLPGVIPLNLASSAISEPMELYEGLSFEDLNRITSAASIASNSQHRFVIGPAIKPGSSPTEVKALGKRWADDYGFAFLKPWIDGGALADLSPQNDLERDIVTCLKRVE